jgi:hypothetical protein
MCHLALLLPLLGLPLFWVWPLDLALPVYAVLLLVSAGVYYRYGIRAQDTPHL